MSISTLLQSVSSLRDLLEASIHPADESSILAALQVVRDHPAYAGAGLLTAFGAVVVAKALKRAIQFRSLDGPASKSFLWGHESLMFEFATSLEIHDQLLTNYGAICKVKGALGEDRLWVADPRAMTEIVLKAYDDFREPEAFLSWIRLTMGPNILVTNGHKHKLQRKILNPVFTASHMRLLTPTITTIAYHLGDIIASKARANGSNTGVVDVFTWMSNVALEIIGQAGMGYSFGVMEEKEPEYLDASRQLFPLIGSMWYFRPFLPYLMKAGSAYFRRFMVEHLPIAPVQAMKKVTDVMDGTAAEIYRRKKEALEKGTLESEIAAGNDIMSALLKQNQVVAPEEQMTEEEIISQVSGLVFAGHDTTSGGLARTLHLLAQNPEVQTRLREEVQEAHRLYGKDLDYDQINSLNYLDAVCRESLRLHSPAQLVERVAQKDWDLPLQYPIKSKDGKSMISNIHVKKGTHIYLSLGSTNRDKQTWGDDADQFKPSRWIQPLPSGVTEAKIPGLYSSTMTFLGGPRACLGFKFSQLEMKLVLSTLVSSFMFELSDAEISWHADGVVKPHVRHKDGTIEQDATLPLKVTVVD